MAYVTSARTGGAVILADHAGSYGKHKEDATMAARFEGITPAARKAKKPGTNTTKGTTTEGGCSSTGGARGGRARAPASLG